MSTWLKSLLRYENTKQVRLFSGNGIEFDFAVLYKAVNSTANIQLCFEGFSFHSGCNWTKLLVGRVNPVHYGLSP